MADTSLDGVMRDRVLRVFVIGSETVSSEAEAAAEELCVSKMTLDALCARLDEVVVLFEEVLVGECEMVDDFVSVPCSEAVVEILSVTVLDDVISFELDRERLAEGVSVKL